MAPFVPARIRYGVALLALLLAAVPAEAQIMTSVAERTAFSSGLPEDTGSTWTRIGTGHALLSTGGELILNDNSAGHLIAYQGYLGLLEAGHEVAFRAEVQIVSNIGGQAALVELSRPGMEVLVELRPDEISVHERDGRDTPRWIGSAAVDLTEFREIEIFKASISDPLGERVVVKVDGVELLEVWPRGTGELGVGRIVFGSLGYPDLGASLWRWVEVRAQWIEQKIPSGVRSVGSLKRGFVD